MTTDSIGVAVIGAGMAGRAHLAAWRNAPTVFDPPLPPVRLVAIADLNAEVAADGATRFGYERVTSDWREVVEADDVDVISIVVANSLHREIAEAALAAGKHVLCEKPLAPSVADAQAMVDAAAAHPELVAATGFVYRRQPAVAAVRERIGEAGLGAPVHFAGHYMCDYACDPDGPMSWRYKGGPGSGALADIGSHLVDQAEFLCGPIASVSGAVFSTTTTQRFLPAGNVVGHALAQLSDVAEPVENEDVATFTVTFARGGAGTLTASRMAFGHANQLGWRLSCERGSAEWDMERPAEFSYADTSSPRGTGGPRQVLIGPDHPYLTHGLPMDFPSVSFGVNDLFVYQARAFLEEVVGIDGGLPRCASFAEGLRNLQILDAVKESAAGGGITVAVPPPAS